MPTLISERLLQGLRAALTWGAGNSSSERSPKPQKFWVNLS